MGVNLAKTGNRGGKYVGVPVDGIRIRKSSTGIAQCYTWIDFFGGPFVVIKKDGEIVFRRATICDSNQRKATKTGSAYQFPLKYEIESQYIKLDHESSTEDELVFPL